MCTIDLIRCLCRIITIRIPDILSMIDCGNAEIMDVLFSNCVHKGIGLLRRIYRLSSCSVVKEWAKTTADLLYRKKIEIFRGNADQIKQRKIESKIRARYYRMQYIGR